MQYSRLFSPIKIGTMGTKKPHRYACHAPPLYRKLQMLRPGFAAIIGIAWKAALGLSL